MTVRSESCGRVKIWGCCLGVALLMIFLVSPVVFADSNWYICSVDLAGPGKSGTFVQLTDQAETPVFVDKWFTFPPESLREMLAVALTAINADKKVAVAVDLDSATYPVIEFFYLKAK
ncbi:MAG: hypothetical protein J7L25_04715 [Deltaproteobacteria bacterium]|nr:hypothetical protein [Candidatus Tharpella aukensis]